MYLRIISIVVSLVYNNKPRPVPRYRWQSVERCGRRPKQCHSSVTRKPHQFHPSWHQCHAMPVMTLIPRFIATQLLKKESGARAKMMNKLFFLIHHQNPFCPENPTNSHSSIIPSFILADPPPTPPRFVYCHRNQSETKGAGSPFIVERWECLLIEYIRCVVRSINHHHPPERAEPAIPWI